MGRVRWRVVQQNGQEIVEELHKIVVHRFSVADAEDPDLYAAQPLYQWEQSEQGQFVMKNSVEQPQWQKSMDPEMFAYKYVIIAELEKKKLSEYLLRWGPIK